MNYPTPMHTLWNEILLLLFPLLLMLLLLLLLPFVLLLMLLVLLPFLLLLVLMLLLLLLLPLLLLLLLLLHNNNIRSNNNNNDNISIGINYMSIKFTSTPFTTSLTSKEQQCRYHQPAATRNTHKHIAQQSGPERRYVLPKCPRAGEARGREAVPLQAVPVLPQMPAFCVSVCSPVG